MKKKITQTLLPIVMGLSLIMQFACSDDDKSGGNYNGPLKLTTFYPDSGYLSSKIIIEGENLGTDASKLSVYFNKKKGYISQASGNILMVYAPKLPGDTCIISVVKGNDSLTFDNKFRYISRFTVENVCGKTGSGYNIGGDLASTTFEAWRLKVGCCDPEGNYYSCYSSFGNNGGLALISEKKKQSKKIISEMVNDVMYHNVTEKLYAVGTQKNVIYEIDPSNDWKVKRRYLKPQDPPAKQIDYNFTACIAYCTTDGYFYGRTATKQLFRFKLEDMVCEYIKNDVYNSTTPETENSYIVSMMFDPTEPTHLYTSYGASSVITMQDVSKPESEEIIYAGHLNVRADNTSTTQVINGYRTDCLFNWNNQMTIIVDESGQKNMYIADAGTQTIRKIDMNTGMVTTVVGRQNVKGNQSGTPLEATFNWPKGVGLTAEGDLYISDCGSGCVRKLSLR